MRFFLAAYILIIFSCSAAYAQGHIALKDSVRIHNIEFDGNKKTDSTVLLRELSVTSGCKIASRDLPQITDVTKKRMMNLPLFSETIVTADTLNDSTIDLHIRVKEQWFIMPEFTLKLADRNINVWWTEHNHDIRRANLGLTLKHRNFRGKLEQLSATVQVGYTQKLGLEYFKPYIDKKQQNGIGASFFVAQNEETYFNTDLNKLLFVKTQGSYIMRQFEAAVLYVHRPGYAVKHTIEARYRDHKVQDTIVKLNPGYYDTGSTRLRLMEFTYRYELNHVDNWNYPLHGLKVVGYSITRVGIQGVGFQQQLMLEAGYFKKLPHKFLWSEIFRGRVSVPSDVPYYFRNALGANSEYVRGYEYYVEDGSHYALLRTDLKYELFNFTMRWIPINILSVIPVRVYPKIFADVGVGYNKFPGNSFLNNRGLMGYGIGVDVVSAYEFKFRLEYAFNHLGENGVFLHLNSE
ncbi:MAG: hypothetical protein JST82_08170 [Bacteroidetes bacterium]|nr:hypothetical protein [Bacteroidota bacterium]